MNCIQCGNDLLAGTKFCPDCGAKQESKCPACGASLNSGARFCGECGAKIEAKNVAAEVRLTKIDIAPLASNLPACKVEILNVNAEGPNNDGEYAVYVKYSVTNETDDDWECIETSTQILSGMGGIAETSSSSQEQTVEAGETVELEMSLWGVKNNLLGTTPDQAHVVVTVTASRMTQAKLGEVRLPDVAYQPVALEPKKIGEAVQVISGSLWKTEPDADKDCRVEVKALVQNLTDKHLPEVRILAQIMDKQGTDITDAGGYDQVGQGAIANISGSSYAKEKKLAGAKTEIAMRVYWPVAAGLSQQQGISIVATENDQGDELDNDSDSDYESADLDEGESIDTDSDHFTGRESAGTRRFYANMKWFSVAEQPDSIGQLPHEFQQAKNLWDTYGESSQKTLIKLLSPFVGARFIANNINGWEELFADPDSSDFVEIEASEVRVVGIDFSESPIPICKAEAEFDIPVTESYATTNLEDWMNDNGYLTDAIIFYWNLPNNDETEDLDLTCGDNQGVECLPIEKRPESKSIQIEEISREQLYAELLSSSVKIEKPPAPKKPELPWPKECEKKFMAIVEKFRREVLEKSKGDKVFVAPNIPSDKLSNAIKSYGGLTKASDVAVLIDSTVFGSATDGLIITAGEIISKDLGSDPKTIPLSDIREIVYKHGFITSNIVINGQEFFMTGGLDKHAMANLVEALKKLSQGLVEVIDMMRHPEKYNTDETGMVSIDQVCEIFYDYEDLLQEKSVLYGIAPKTMVGVSLIPEYYDDSGTQKIKCWITIACSAKSTCSEDTLESISDTVSDYCRDHDLAKKLRDLGLPDDIIDWWPVKFDLV